MSLPDNYTDAVAELKSVREQLLDLKTIEAELLIVLARAEKDGSKVIAIEAVRQVLSHADDEEARARDCCCAGCVAGTLCDNADDEERAKAWRWPA